MAMVAPLWPRGVQPNGPLRIDWTNPVSRGLVTCVFGKQDLVTGCPLTLVGTNRLNVRGGAFGIDTVNGDDSNAAYCNGAHAVERLQGKTHMSIFAALFYGVAGGSNERFFKISGTTGSTETIIGIGGTSTQTSNFLWHPAAGRRLEEQAGTFYTSDQNHTISFGKDDTDTLRVCRDGVLETDTDTALTEASAADDVTSPTIMVMCRNTAGTFVPDARMGICMAWDRALTDAEHLALASDPYLCLMPAVDIPVFTSAATATISGSGAISLAAMEAAGTAQVEKTGSGAITTAAMTVSGTGERQSVATGVIDLPAQTLAGTGELERTATAAITLAAQTVTGAAERELTGTGAVTLGATALSGTAELERTGTGAITLPATLVSGTSEPIVTATGAITLGAVLVSATAEREVTATAAFNLAAVDVSGNGAGAQNIVGSAAIQLAAMQAAGTGKKSMNGTGAITLAAQQIAGQAERAVTAAAAVTLPGVELSATGKRAMVGAAAITFAAMEVTGTIVPLSRRRVSSARTSRNKLVFTDDPNEIR